MRLTRERLAELRWQAEKSCDQYEFDLLLDLTPDELRALLDAAEELGCVQSKVNYPQPCWDCGLTYGCRGHY